MKKRILIVCLVFVLMLGLGLGAFAAVTLGDVDGDGEITAFDAQLIAEYKAGQRQLDDTQLEAAGDLSVQDVINDVLTQEPEIVYPIAGIMTENAPFVQYSIDKAAAAGSTSIYIKNKDAGYALANMNNAAKTVTIAQKGVSGKPTCLEFYHKGEVIDSNAWVIYLDCAYELDTADATLNFYVTEDPTNGVRFQLIHRVDEINYLRRQIWRDGNAMPEITDPAEQIMQIPAGTSWSGSFMMMYYNQSIYLFAKNDQNQYLMLTSYMVDYENCTPQFEVTKQMDVTLSNIKTIADESQVQALYKKLVKPDEVKGEARVLFLSNSNIFVFDTPNTFARLAKEAGYYVEANAVAKTSAAIADFNDTESYLHQLMLEELARGDYDAVYFNGLGGDGKTEESTLEVTAASEILAATIREAGETPALFARPSRYLVDGEIVVLTDGKIYDEFYSGLGETLGTDVCYAVRAFALAYQEDPNIGLWGEDQKHVSAVGAYLNGCVLFCHTFGVSCENVGDDFLDAETAAFLRDIADRVVLEGEMPNW